MNKKIFFILLINCFVSYVYAAQEVQNSQVLEIKSRQGKPEKNKTENNKKKKTLDDEAKAKAYLNDLQQEENLLKKKPSYLSPTKSSEGSSLSKESTEKEWKNSLRSDKKPTIEKNNKKEEQDEEQNLSVPHFSKKIPVNPVNKSNTKVTSGVGNPNMNGPLEEGGIKKINKKEEILKKILQLDQDIVAIENQMIKFEHDDIKEKMNASDREELKKPMKKFKDEKIEEKKKLETEFRNLEEKIPEKNFGKELMSQLGKKIQEDALRDKKYENEISNLLKKEQEKKEKEQKAQREQASKKGFLGSIKSFFKQ